ncbi:unnamed protein product, partial [Pylaiella littoralis]
RPSSGFGPGPCPASAPNPKSFVAWQYEETGSRAARCFAP